MLTQIACIKKKNTFMYLKTAFYFGLVSTSGFDSIHT